MNHMSNLIIILFFIDFILFLYVFLYGLILNILLFKNKKIIENYLDENGCRLYVSDAKSGKITSRKTRLKLIEALISENIQVKNRKFFICILKMYNSLYFAFAGIVLIILLFVCIAFLLKV